MKIYLCLVLASFTAYADQSEGTRLRFDPSNMPPVPKPPRRELKVDQLKPAIDLISQAITRAVERKPEAVTTTSIYFQEIGRVFAAAETNANFSADSIINDVNKVVVPLNADPYAYEVKNLILVVYKLAYEDRMSAENSPLEWLARVTRQMKLGISAGLKATGREGVQ